MLPTDINCFPSECILLIQIIKSEILKCEYHDISYAYEGVLFRNKHCKAVSDTGILCFQFPFVVKKRGGGEGRKKERKKKRMLDTINPLYLHTKGHCVFFSTVA